MSISCFTYIECSHRKTKGSSKMHLIPKASIVMALANLAASGTTALDKVSIHFEDL